LRPRYKYIYAPHLDHFTNFVINWFMSYKQSAFWTKQCPCHVTIERLHFHRNYQHKMNYASTMFILHIWSGFQFLNGKPCCNLHMHRDW
jgi:hypothetical protein